MLSKIVSRKANTYALRNSAYCKILGGVWRYLWLFWLDHGNLTYAIGQATRLFPTTLAMKSKLSPALERDLFSSISIALLFLLTLNFYSLLKMFSFSILGLRATPKVAVLFTKGGAVP